MKLMWIQEGTERYLGDSNYFGAKSKGSGPASLESVTLGELCQYCDDEAEGANYHQFVGVHEKLGDLIQKHSTEKAAKEVMYEIATAGGLHEFR